MTQTESEFLYHTSCDNCNSSDANSVYSDGHAYCFSCNTTTQGQSTMELTPITKQESNFIKGEHLPLNKRKINLDTVQKYNYQVGAWFARPCHIANYYNDSKELVAQKLRYPSKDFQWLGNPKEAGLFGQETCKGRGKYLTVCEGEIDALTMSQSMDNNKWDVVSIKTGAAGAKKDIQKSLEFLEGYENVIFMFDQDEHGQKAALECAKLLTPNKAKIASLPLKDPNEMLLAGKQDKLVKAMWDAKPYRPDGIVLGSEIFDDIMKEDNYVTAQYPFKSLNDKTHGLRKG